MQTRPNHCRIGVLFARLILSDGLKDGTDRRRFWLHVNMYILFFVECVS